MKRIVRNEKLTSDESAKLNIIRNRVANELPSLIEAASPDSILSPAVKPFGAIM